MKQKKAAITIYEDRPEYEVGIKLLVSSLCQHLPEADVHLFAPKATPDLQNWLNQYPATLHSNVFELSGWNVKPSLLLWALDQGYERGIWFDSDMIVAKRPPDVLYKGSSQVLVVSQLPRASHFDTHEHTAGWKLELGRRFIRVPSGCCMSATESHRQFIEQWKAMLGSAEYQHWQAQPRHSRPLYFRGSDAVLLALLGSKAHETLPIHLLKSGRNIAQCLNPSSYTPDERIVSLIHGTPPIVHAMGDKPWMMVGKAEQLYAAMSPYACVARRYSEVLGGSSDWLEIPQAWAKRWYGLVNGHPALASLPFCLHDWLKRLGIRSTISTIRYFCTGTSS